MSLSTVLAEAMLAQEFTASGVLPVGTWRLPHQHELAAETRFGDLDALQDEVTEQVTGEVALTRDALVVALTAYLLSLGTPSTGEVLAAVNRLTFAATLTLLGPEYRLTRERSLTEVGEGLRRFVVTSQAGMVAEVARQGLDVTPRDTPTEVTALLGVLAAQAVDNPLVKAVTAATAAARAAVTDPASADPVQSVIRAVTTAVAPARGPGVDGVDAGTRDLARQAVGQAEAAGRADVLADLDGRARIYASELRDRATCEPCSTVDGREYPDLAAALADYPTAGGFRACLGGLRCRGTLVAVAVSEVAPSLVVPGDYRVGYPG